MAATDPTELIITDPHTCRDIRWQVTYCKAYTPTVAERVGFSHMLGIKRPKGGRSYIVNADIVDGMVIRNETNPRKVF